MAQKSGTVRIVADEAREIRRRLSAARRRAPLYLNDFASGQRGHALAKQLAFLAGTMLDGGYTPREAEEGLSRLAARAVQHTLMQRAS